MLDGSYNCLYCPAPMNTPRPSFPHRRDRLFEDTFHQLRTRTPEEMRLKLSVSFAGEEGIDAGGVSREWYQVRLRGACRTRVWRR